MNRNLPSQPVPAAAPRHAPPGRRRLLLVLLLLLLGAGGAYWLYSVGRNLGTTGPSKGGPAAETQRPPCSDDDDPKYLEQLEFGPPIEVRFDRQALDALAGRPIPAIEVYPWQPEGLVAVLGEHRMRGQLFAVSRDGKTVAVARAGEPYVRVGGVDTLHEKHVLVSAGGVRALAWSPDGSTLAVAGGDGEVRLFDVRSPAQAPVTLARPPGPVTALSFARDGKYLLGGDNTPKRGAAQVWDVTTRQVVRQLRHIGPVLGVAFSPVAGDYRALTAGGPEDGQVHLWDALAGRELAAADLRPTKTDVTAAVSHVAFSPDGKRALSCHSDRAVRLWDLERLEKGKELQTLRGQPAGPAPLAAFTPDGEAVATALAADNGVWLWGARDGRQLRRLATAVAVYALDFLSDSGRLIYAGSLVGDSNLHVHETATGAEVMPPVGHLAALTCVALAPQGGAVASGGQDVSVRLWDLGTVRQRHALGAGGVWGVGFHPDGRQALFFGAASGQLAFADVETGQLRTPRYNDQHGGGVRSAAMTADGRYAVTGGNSDGTVRMWRLADGRQVRKFIPTPDPGPVLVTVAPDMRRAIRVSGRKTRLLHLRCQEIKHEWDPVAWAPFLPDGRAVFLGGKDAPAWKITAEGVAPSEQYPLDLSGATPGQVSGDGRRVAAVVGAGAGVFGLATGRRLWTWTPPPHFGGVQGVALSPDGGHLLTANGDGTAYVVRLP